ncbi:tyrosine phosphatase family protein [Brucella pseudogrignonensis]|uniref:tyrosine phosphatase family protein n=1 Tax=Brucella pseudogrignonensis TaxID=419475 RepID=UPI0028BB1425|nr:tyrosine phosphatase family protein [Brucella pseudogrignonensis]MDT6940445.1 tyrosine phosphatase family protein [Brucella pseudogrignonensis]
MAYIVVSPLSKLEAQIALHEPSHIVTLSSHALPALPGEAERLSLLFNDITEPRDGLTMPDESHVRALLDFAMEWDRAKPLLIHCYAGVSRSTASAYIIASALDLSLDETALAEKLRELSPSATPNIRLIALADNMLRRDGRMVAAIKAIGRGQEAFEGEVFNLPVAN